MTTHAPLPPLNLAQRVEDLSHSEDPLGHYEYLGEEAREQIISMLPAGWSFQGRRVLDFGCGSGRTLRHFLPEAEEGEFWGCDIDEPSVEWLRQNLSPPLNVFHNPLTPPMPVDDGQFDLIYALSVFTHLPAETSSAWLLDLHRALKDDGILLATYMGQATSEWIAGEPWDPDRVGMNVLNGWQEWDAGGPSALMSEWWVRSHWGRAFEIVDIIDEPFMAGTLGLQSWALLRKRPVELSAAELDAPEPGEEREVAALRHNVAQLQAQVEAQRATLTAENAELREELQRALALLEELKTGYESSVSWRATQPLRKLKRSLRRDS